MTDTPTSQPGAHVLDLAAFADYLTSRLQGVTPPLAARQFAGGMSNPTFELTDAVGRRFVLRKKPPGDLLPSAHAVDREFRIMSALKGGAVPVADPLMLCMDDGVIGQAFYVMAHVDGRVFRELELPGMAPHERAAVYDAMNATLANLHRVDWRAAGLQDFGREGGYAARQVKRWTGQYQASATDHLAAMDRLIEWLPDNVPTEAETTIAHGDFRLENMIFHPTEAKVLAVVDWELATLGDPLADLAYNCLPWHMPDPRRGDLRANDPAATGIPSETDYLAAYARRTGRADLGDWTFYLVLSLFRLGAIAQGVYKRGLDGNATSAAALQRRDVCRNLSEIAWSLIEQAGRD
ncbi:MAG: phosphotransferase family protein [Rhodospirillales bacterium CG15_BIG_FIL_POST_REV_8_21_14_020_66_15]|nr:MAG: phosphotransferase family protein [Rhodospirillales bacterium CG15_BIG_FIL_POST_REV_8_21_14_020_66_15]